MVESQIKSQDSCTGEKELNSSTNNQTFTKSLARVGIDGMWISKETGKNRYDFHYHRGNQSLCNQVKLLDPKPKSYKILSRYDQYNCCKACNRLLLNKEKIKQKDTLGEKISSLYDNQSITLEGIITNFITHPDNHPAKYYTVKETFEENFLEFSFEDTVSFMAVQNQISLQDDCILPVVDGEILS